MQMDPLHQFQIVEYTKNLYIGFMNVNFTNSAFFMFVSVFLVGLFLFLGTRNQKIVPDRMQMLVESSYNFVFSMLEGDLSKKDSIRYFPYIYTLFMFFLFGNLLGVMPYSFTFNSHIVVTFFAASVVLTSITVIGIFKNGVKFFSIFMPQGVSPFLAPLLIPIEVMSYFSRVISLSVRLFANMMAGHIMLKVFAIFVIGTGFLGILPLLVNVAVIGFEIFVALIQTYIFTVLTCVYLNNAINLH